LQQNHENPNANGVEKIVPPGEKKEAGIAPSGKGFAVGEPVDGAEPKANFNVEVQLPRIGK